MAKRTPNEIIALVEAEEGRTKELRNRFNEDFSLYRLDSFKGLEHENEIDTEEGYAHYTSNEPQTFADKIITFTVDSKMMLRIKHPDAEEQQRKIDDQKERFVFGILRAGDERLIRLMKPRAKMEMAFHAAIRGFIFGRALLTKREDGTTFVDITPWDPLNTY